MLISLLPLAGWAEGTMDKVTVKVQSIEYGGYNVDNPSDVVEALNVLVIDEGFQMTEGTHYTYAPDAFYTDEACTVAAGITQFAELPVGTYYLKINGMGVYTGWKAGVFNVKKRTLTVTATTSFVKNYLAPDPELVCSVSGNIEGDDVADILNASSASYTYSGTDANADVDGNYLEGMEGYAIKFSGFSLKSNDVAKNYNLVIADAFMKIKQVELSNTTPFEITADQESSEKVYDATAFAPTYTLTYTYDEDKTYTLTADDYDYIYKSGEDATEAIYAGNYTAYASGKGNFVGEAELGEFSITKKEVTVVVVPKTKEYDGAAYNPDDAEFAITGLAAADEGKINGLTLDEASESGLGKNVANYAVSPYFTSATIGDGDGAPLFTDNYDASALPSMWKIVKRAITVGALDVTVVKGADIEDPDVYVNWGEDEEAISDEEELAIIETFKIVEKEGLTSESTGTIEDAFVVTAKEDGEDGYNADVFTNYSITTDNANLIVTGKSFTIMPILASTIQYGTTLAPQYITYTTDLEPATVDESKITYQYLTVGDEEWSTEAPTTIGSYRIRIAEAEGLGTGDYANVEITYSEVPFNIVPKTITVTVAPVTLHVGDDVDNLIKYASATAEGVIEGEEVEFEFKLNPADYPDGILDAPTEGNDDGIIVTLKEGAKNNANYQIDGDAAYGNLVVLSTRLLFVDQTDPNTINRIGDAAEACEDMADMSYDVTFSARKLNANKWNVVVMPFDVTPFEFCDAIGCYAAFNLLTEADATTNKIKFGLELSNLPANTPFLVKPEKDVEFAKEIDEIMTYVTFTDRVIKGDDPIQEMNGVKFIGTYKDIAISGNADETILAMQGGKFKSLPETATDVTLGFTRAYLDLSGSSISAPVIELQEADGSITAISTISADGVAIEADGWYTISGIKLDSAPTEKGVYVRNGKKFVVK